MLINEAYLENRSIVEFKKSLFGFDKKEVLEYIEMLNQNLIKAREVYEEKLKEMKNNIEILNREKSNREEKIQKMIKDYEVLLNERDALKQEIESIHNTEDELYGIKSENQQLKQKIEEFNYLEEENRQLKKQMVEIETVSQMREQQQSKLISEIDMLNEQNRNLLNLSLDEQNRREAEISAKNLKLTQILQMHRFSLGQSREVLKRLINQFDESCNLAEKIDIDAPQI